jgi:hypothetical protein
MFAYSEGARFDAALLSAVQDEEVPPRVRAAYKAVWCARDERHAPVGPLERRLWATLSAARAGRANESAIVDLALRIVSG